MKALGNTLVVLGILCAAIGFLTMYAIDKSWEETGDLDRIAKTLTGEAQRLQTIRDFAVAVGIGGVVVAVSGIVLTIRSGGRAGYTSVTTDTRRYIPYSPSNLSRNLGEREGDGKHVWNLYLPDGTSHSVILQAQSEGSNVVTLDLAVVGQFCDYGGNHHRFEFKIGRYQAYITTQPQGESTIYKLFVDGKLIQ